MLAGASVVVLLLPALRKRLHRDREEERVTKRFFASLTVIFATTLALLFFQRAAYVNRATNHFEQLAQIVAPFQTEQERLLVRSQFAQVASRQEYVKVLDSLAKVGRENNTRLPEFTVY